jgi:hypothetical protein
MPRQARFCARCGTLLKGVTTHLADLQAERRMAQRQAAGIDDSVLEMDLAEPEMLVAPDRTYGVIKGIALSLLIVMVVTALMMMVLLGA